MRLFQKSSPTEPSSLVSQEDFEKFYDQTHLNVFRYVMVLCAGNQDEAEDITADAFFRAWEKRQQFSGGPSAALGWVITIARNILIDRRRSEGVHPVETILDEAITDQNSNIEEILVDEEQFRAVFDTLHRLPFPQGDIFTLRYMLGWRVKTIADHLGLAENTVSVHLRRATAKLQKILIPQTSNEGRTA